MNLHVHKKLIIRLLLAWIGLSVLIGAVVFYIEIRKIDAHVVALVTKESYDYEKNLLNFINNPNPLQLKQLQKETSSHVEDGHFIALKIYNRNHVLTIEASHPDVRLLEREISRQRRTMIMTDTIHFKTFYQGISHIYVLVMKPLKAANNETAGYFEGVYRVDSQLMGEITGRVLFSLLQIIAIIFFTTLAIYPIVLFQNRGLIKLTGDLYHANIGMLKVLGGAIAKRDSETNIHNYRVTIYAIRLAEAAGLKRKYIAALIKGSFLHDVGKIAISDLILLKPGKLTDDEMTTMKTHVRHGVDIVGNYGWLKDATDVVRYHHEKFDGTGYDAGLKGHDIPINARIFSVVDVFDALTSRRPYKEPFSLEEAMHILKEGKGNHFDPILIDAFADIADPLYKEISGTENRLLEETVDELIDQYFSKGFKTSARMNCWEFMKCGREVGGAKAQELGVCPAYPDHGRHCARLVGTLCEGEVQGSFARKFRNCWKCPFFRSKHYDRVFGMKTASL